MSETREVVERSRHVQVTRMAANSFQWRMQSQHGWSWEQMDDAVLNEIPESCFSISDILVLFSVHFRRRLASFQQERNMQCRHCYLNGW